MSSIAPRAVTGRAGAVVVVTLLLVAGCSKEELNDLVEKGKQQVDQASASVTDAAKSASEKAQQVASQATQTSEQAKQKLGQAGEMKFTLDAPVAAAGCYVKYVPPQAGRPGVLQLRSYAEPASELFPSVYLRATSTAENAAALRDQNLTGQMFVQKEKGGPVWQADANGLVQLKITQVDDKSLVAEIVGGSLRSFPDGKASTIQGSLQGFWQ